VASQEAPNEILDATVTSAAKHGVFVQTKRGEGLVPLRELGLPPGSDHRRAYPVGKKLRVVTVGTGGGRLTFSSTRVTHVEERSNYREFSSGSSAASAASLGSLGDLFGKKLGVAPAPRPEPTPVAAPSPNAPPVQKSAVPKPPAAPAHTQASISPKPSGPKKAEAPRRDVPGVVRRKR
jgi:hypothetical protein